MLLCLLVSILVWENMTHFILIAFLKHNLYILSHDMHDNPPIEYL